MTVRSSFFIVYALLIVIFIASLSVISRSIRVPTQETQLFCLKDAARAKKTFQDTKWKDFDFYQSCLDNITHTSSLSR